MAAGCGGGDDEGEQAAPGEAAVEQVITVNWGTEPPSLDPGLASDTTSANILYKSWSGSSSSTTTSIGSPRQPRAGRSARTGRPSR
jgi:hypothetical protein